MFPGDSISSSIISGLYISNIKVFPGPLELVKQQNPHIFKKSTVAPGNMITRKLGFPAVINPSKFCNVNQVRGKLCKSEVGWPSGLRRYVQVVVYYVGAGSNPASTCFYFIFRDRH